MASRVVRLFPSAIDHARAHVAFRAFRDRLQDLPAAEVVRASTEWHGGRVASLQLEDEITALLEEVRALRPSVVLEIGTAKGGTLLFWSLYASDDALLVSVDLPGGPFGGGHTRFQRLLLRRFRRARQSLHLLRADSHQDGTLTRVQHILGLRKVDLLFLDGDHTYQGARSDFERYTPLVRSGGLIVLHDIASAQGDTEVAILWREVKDEYAHHEFVSRPGGEFGIGVLVAD